MTKYKAGDVVHVRLTDNDAYKLNSTRLCVSIDESCIIAHIPAPEPVVRWVNVYRGDVFEYASLGDAKENVFRKAIDERNYGFTARLEWPDGDRTSPPIVTVEDV